LELEELKSRKSLQQVVLLQLLARINYEIFLTRGRRKLLIIDEAWELLDDPMMAKALEALYRKARKYDAAIIIVTQSIADLYRSENAQAISENSAWQFILQQKTESIDAAIKTEKFSIDSYGANLLKSVHTNKGRYSEVMVKNGNSYGVFRLVVNRFTQVAFSTSGDERTIPLDLIEEGVDPKVAIEQYILERG
jgi:conjugal transfer ATP-binding protein TraC